MTNGISKLRPPPAPPAVIREGGRNLSEPFLPTPSRRYSGRGSSSIRWRFCQSVGSQPLFAALTTFPVCLVPAMPIQAGTRPPSFPAPSVGVNLRSCILCCRYDSRLVCTICTLLPREPPPRPILGHGRGRGTGNRPHPPVCANSISRPSENIS